MSRDTPKIEIAQAAWHRNGVGGVGFYAVLFDDAEQGRMVAALYDEPGFCSVLRVADLSDPKRGVGFGLNSWRGDVYEYVLRPALETWLASNGSGRIGPFSIPVGDETAAQPPPEEK